jgi:sterol desaturase/sphingolipid hydroxylase (fatty acid hydroxylase superfamily)
MMNIMLTTNTTQLTVTARMKSTKRRMLKRIDSILDYSLWPLLLGSCLLGMGYGMSQGHGTLAFNLTYFSLAGVLFLLEKWRPHEQTWLESDGQELQDVGHTALTKSMVQLLVVSLSVLGLTEVVGGDQGTGFWPNHWPMFWQVVLGMVLAEFGLYWAHRLGHEWGWLWRFHAVHHSSKRLWFLNTGRFHIMDTLASIVFSAPILAIAGAPNAVVMWFGAITAYIGFLTHCNIRMRFGWLNYIFNTPGLHRWHHSMDLREGDKNYGENLMLWDLIFGTYFDDPNRRPPEKIGMKHAMPRRFIAQLIEPFRWQKLQEEAKAGRDDLM